MPDLSLKSSNSFASLADSDNVTHRISLIMGNLASRRFNPATDLVDLKGKVAIVTGGK